MMENLSLSTCYSRTKESAEKERETEKQRQLRGMYKALSLVPRSVFSLNGRAKEEKSLSLVLMKRVRESDFEAQRGALSLTLFSLQFFFLISLNRERFETRLHHFLIFRIMFCVIIFYINTLLV